MSMFVRLADGCGGEPIPAIQKALFRNLVAAALAWVAFRRGSRGGKGAPRAACALPPGLRVRADLALRAVFGTCGIFANFYALSHIPVGDAMALNKTAPFFTLLLSWALMGERMTLKQALCVAGAFAGALLVVRPGRMDALSLPAAIGLASGLCAGAAYAFLHRLGRAGADGAFIILFFSVCSCAACIPFIACDWHPMNGMQTAVLMAAGASAAAGQFGITWAYRFAEPRQIAVYDYTGIVFAAALGFIAFGQTPDPTGASGLLIIIGMGVALHLRRKTAPGRSEKKSRRDGEHLVQYAAHMDKDGDIGRRSAKGRSAQRRKVRNR